jgi:tetratricopeptide (TPR) repeat protein
LGLYERAEISLHKALELNEGDQSARLTLINAYIRSGKYVEALEHINTVFSNNPSALRRQELELIKLELEKALSR